MSNDNKPLVSPGVRVILTDETINIVSDGQTVIPEPFRSPLRGVPTELLVWWDVEYDLLADWEVDPQLVADWEVDVQLVADWAVDPQMFAEWEVTEPAASPDTWTSMVSNMEGSGIFALESGGGTWLIGSSATDRVARSSDGFAWTRITVPTVAPNAINPTDLAYFNGVFIATKPGDISGNSRIARTADNGDNWTFPSTAYTQTSSLTRARYAGDSFWACGGSGLLGRSADGTSWTFVLDFNTVFTTSDINDITYSPTLGIYVAVGSTGKIATSVDGTSWALIADSSFATSRIMGIVWDPVLTIFVAVGQSGKIATSPDGINWTQRTSNFGVNQINDIALGAGYFVVVGNGGNLDISPNGVDWTPATSTFGTSIIRRVIYDGGKFIIAGDAGKLAYSVA